MKCPYCAEEIKNEALVCRHCKRDLSFFKPFEARLQTLESRISEVTVSITDIAKTIESIKSEGTSLVSNRPVNQSDRIPFLYLALIASLSILISFGLVMLSSYLRRRIPYPDSGGDFEAVFERRRNIFLMFLPFLLASPIPFGLWLGIKWRGSHLRIYAILGLIVGVIEALIAFGLDQFFDPQISLIIIARASFGFITGGLIGDWIERKRFPATTKSGFAENIAKQFVSRTDRSPEGSIITSDVYENRVKRVANMISALAPFLALIGSIITSYFGYLAALAAAAKK